MLSNCAFVLYFLPMTIFRTDGLFLHIFDCCLLNGTTTAVVCNVVTLFIALTLHYSQWFVVLIDFFFFSHVSFVFFSFLPLAQWNYYGVDFTLLDMWTKASPALHLWQHCQLVSWPPVTHPPLRVQVKWRRASFARCAWRTCSRSTNSKNTTRRSTLGMTAM